MTLSITSIILAILPILVVLYLMIGRRWGGSEAGLAGWAAAVVIGILFFGADTLLLLVAFGKSLLLSLYVLYIIWMALLLYNVTNDAGVIGAIGQELPRLAADRGAQALLLAWAFASFLQGASGFGVPAAIVAPLLVGLGFAPSAAVVVALIGHAWAVSFGSLGSSFLALEAASQVDGHLLAGPTALLLGLACLLCGVFVLWSAGGWTAFRRRGVLLLLAGLVMAAGQYAVAVTGFWTLASFLGSLAGMVFLVVFLRRDRGAAPPFNARPLMVAFWPYLILTFIILLGQGVVGDWLGFAILNYNFPTVETSLGWVTAGGPGRSIDLFGHPGALLFYSSLIIFFWYRRRGVLPTAAGPLNGRRIAVRTVQRSIQSTISIIALVAMGTTMQHTGMTQLLADTLSSTGRLFPFLSPFIGALGAFMTGSNTNSNVVFADLQRQTAMALNLSVPFILAAQTAGGAIGSAFAPAKVVVGVSTVAGADEGVVLKLATLYGLAIIAIIGGLALFL